MNVHVNLLPEARILKLKAQSRRRFVGTLTGLVCGITAAIIIVLVMLQVFLLSTYQLNQNRIADLKTTIGKSHEMEQQTATLQANLNSFYTLNQERLYASRVFTNLGNTIPSGVTVNSFQISDDNVVTITGTANSFADVASFAKALTDYNVNYKPQPELERKPLFTDVSITSLSKDATSGKVNFSMTFKVDTSLFKNAASNNTSSSNGTQSNGQ